MILCQNLFILKNFFYLHIGKITPFITLKKTEFDFTSAQQAKQIRRRPEVNFAFSISLCGLKKPIEVNISFQVESYSKPQITSEQLSI